MEHIDKLAERIRKYAQDSVNLHDQSMVNYSIKTMLRMQLDEVVKVVNNIRETSLNDKDKTERILALEEKTGLSFIDLLALCS